MEINSGDFFRNLKNLPPPGTRAFEDLISWEVEKCLGGVFYAGIKIPGWLYFHTNHWKIRVDLIDNYGNIIRRTQLPDLRDNEWERAEALEECLLSKKGYMEIGLRQGGKSEFEASITGYNALLFRDTQNVIVGGNKPDLELLTDKLDHGLRHVWEGIGIGKIDKDWRKTTVRLGYKDKNNEPHIWSYIMIRNADEGLNTETSAGTTAKGYVMDEVGKYSFSQVFEAAKPAFLSEFGWRCIPILVGTGGSFQKGADAERFFNNPDANNFLAFLDPETGKRTCKFISGLYRSDCKIQSNLASYLRCEKGIILTEEQIFHLEKIEIKISDKLKAEQVIREERSQKAKDPDQSEYLKLIMYFPLTPAECFLTANDNLFNVDIAKRQQTKLRELNLTGVNVEIVSDGQKLIHSFTDKSPVSSYPVKSTESKAGCIVIYEPPIPGTPFGLYVAGVDPYRHDQSQTSPSLGAIYIYKRMHDITGEKYQNMIVAQYVGRPAHINEWNETVRNLIKYYNAYTLVESDEYSFIQYMILKGETRYLVPQPDWLKDITPNSSVRRQFGIPATPKVISYLNQLLKTYLEESISVERDEEGNIIKEILGISRILDPVLLDEIINFSENGNFDRIRAFSIAIAAATNLDAQNILANNTEDPRLQSYFNIKRRKINILFGKSTASLFSAAKKHYR